MKAQNLSTTDPSNRALNRLLFGGAADVTLDSVGRVLIPPYLRTYAQLGDAIVIVGAGQYLEVWDAPSGRSSRPHATMPMPTRSASPRSTWPLAADVK